MRAIKYLLFLTLPITVSISFIQNGWLTFLPVITFFIIVPLLELFFKPKNNNFNEEEEEVEKNNKFYTHILYLAATLHLFFLLWFLIFVHHQNIPLIDFIGKITSMGMMCGVIGINVGHELGHRNNRMDILIGEVLLLSSLNMHFLPYHNAGHHFNVATKKDEATDRRNENVYIFWISSHFQSYYQAWILENKKLLINNKPWYHYQNRMVIYTIASLTLIFQIFYFLSIKSLFAF